MSFNNKNYTFIQILIIKFIFFIIIFFLIIGAITTTIKSKNFPTKKIILKTTTTEPTLNLTSQTKPITWMKVYGGDKEDSIKTVLPTRDGNYIAAGYTCGNRCNVLVMKLDILGNIQWAKTYVSGYNSEAHFIISTLDGGYIIAGEISILEQSKILILKLDSLGNLQWAKIYEGERESFAHYISQTLDGGYIVTGYTDVEGSDDILVIKLGFSGNLQWARTYGGGEKEDAYFVSQVLSGGYIVIGDTSSYGSGDYDILILKLDRLGNLQWAKTYGSGEQDLVYSVSQTPDGGYVVIGSTYDQASSGTPPNVLIFKLDSSNNVQWVRRYDISHISELWFISPTPDGGYVATGPNYSPEFYDDILIFKLDSSGNVQWAKIYGTCLSEKPHSILPTSDKGYMVIGELGIFGILNDDILIFKLDSLGNISNCFYGQPITLHSTSSLLYTFKYLIATSVFSFSVSVPSLSASSSPLSSYRLCP